LVADILHPPSIVACSFSNLLVLTVKMKKRLHSFSIIFLCHFHSSVNLISAFSLSLFQDFHRKPPWRLSRNPDMKIVGKAVDFCGTREKRERNEERILMGKKANAFFFPGSSFLSLSFFSHDFHRKKRRSTTQRFSAFAYIMLSSLL